MKAKQIYEPAFFPNIEVLMLDASVLPQYPVTKKMGFVAMKIFVRF